MRYEEIRIALSQDRAEAVSDWLAEQGLGYQLADHTTLDPPQKGLVRFHVFVPPPEGPALVLALRDELGDGAEITTSGRDEDEWRDAWKRYFTTRRLGRLAIVPSWEVQAHRPAPGEVTLLLDPGRAFGTGGHASTRLCLLALDRLAAERPAVDAVLDVGCGCGVLAIAALLLWPGARGAAVDIDPEAVEVTAENAGLNGVHGRLTIGTTPVEDVPGRYGLVLANLSGPTLLELAAPLRARLEAGGALVLSGLLSSEAEQVGARFRGLGLELIGQQEEDEWAALVLGTPR